MNSKDRKHFHQRVADANESGQAYVNGRELIAGMRFSYRSYPYTIQSFMREVEPGAHRKIVQDGLEYWEIDLCYCTASDATFVHGTGLGAVYAPVDKIKTFDMANWSSSDLASAQEKALSLGQQGSFAITIHHRLWGDE